MKLYSENEQYKLYEGNMLDMLEVIKPNSIDAIVTDPPYELGFMGKSWDSSGIAFQKSTWEKCFEVLKPGGYILAFGGSRTFHRIACAIEDAGFEIRDTIMYLYGSGFPKSMNIGLAIDKKMGVESKVVGVGRSGKPETHTNSLNLVNNPFGGEYEIKEAQNEWNGWGTQLKPSYEPIVVARKPCEGSIVDNVLKYGVGGINIDECRVGNEERTIPVNAEEIEIKQNGTHMDSLHKNQQHERVATTFGRFPANVIHDGSEEAISGFPTSEHPNGSITNPNLKNSLGNNGIYGKYSEKQPLWDAYQDSGSAARYFYCAKTSKFDREEGLEELEGKKRFQQGNYSQSPVCSVCGKTFNGTNDHSLCGEHTMIYKSKEDNTVVKNNHPTVKPCELMRYLIRLVSPKGATILDPFNGSGSTGKAAMLENKEFGKNYKYIGIELTEEYLPIAKARIEYICNTDFVFKENERIAIEKVEDDKEYNLFNLGD